MDSSVENVENYTKEVSKMCKTPHFSHFKKNKDMFNRTIIHELEQWKERRDRKPLMMLGARQVGKTSVLKKFGKDSFEHCAYFSLDEEEGVHCSAWFGCDSYGGEVRNKCYRAQFDRV